MTQPPAIPRRLHAAYEVLKAAGICQITGSLTFWNERIWSFTIAFDIAWPNVADLPALIEFNVLVPHTYPYGEIEFLPKGTELRGFPHQATDGGKICLPSAQGAPWDEQRLLVHVQWAKEWLDDAADGRLLPPGDPFELPDFRVRDIHDADLREIPQVLTDESPDTFSVWDGRCGQTGDVLLDVCRDTRAVAAVEFFAADGVSLRRAPFSQAFLQGASEFRGQWLLLPRLTFFRNRPPQTCNELRQLATASNVDSDKVLRRAWANSCHKMRYGIILLGCPIPAIVGAPPQEVHWQPLLIPNQEASKRRFRGKGKIDQGRLWANAIVGPFADPHLLIWGQSTNISRSRQYARGAAPSEAARERVAVVGAGAIGSIVIDSLARAGLQDISVFDDDRLEFGNLCRHTLDGSHVGKHKASALCTRLSLANPLSTIKAFPHDLPLLDFDDSRSHDALDRASVMIDCSTDQGAFLWLSRTARQNKKRLASLFINLHATLLTLVLSGRNASGKRVFDKLNQAVADGATPIDRDEYFGHGDAKFLPGAGCWNPTFPARNNHIAMLVAAAVDLLYDWLEHPYECDGRAIVIHRRDASPIIDIAWDSKYR